MSAEVVTIVVVVMVVACSLLWLIVRPVCVPWLIRAAATRKVGLPGWLYEKDINSSLLLSFMGRADSVEASSSGVWSLLLSVSGYEIHVRWMLEDCDDPYRDATLPSQAYSVNYQCSVQACLPDGVYLKTVRSKKKHDERANMAQWADDEAPGGKVTAMWPAALALAGSPAGEPFSRDVRDTPEELDSLYRAARTVTCTYSGVVTSLDNHAEVREQLHAQCEHVLRLAQWFEGWESDSLELHCVEHVLRAHDELSRSLALSVLLRMYRWSLDEVDLIHGEVRARLLDESVSWQYEEFIDVLPYEVYQSLSDAQLRTIMMQTGDEVATSLLERRLELGELLCDESFTFTQRLLVLEKSSQSLTFDVLEPWIMKLSGDDFARVLFTLTQSPEHALWCDERFFAVLLMRSPATDYDAHARLFKLCSAHPHSLMGDMNRRVYRAQIDRGDVSIPFLWGLELLSYEELSIPRACAMVDAMPSHLILRHLLDDHAMDMSQELVMLTGALLGDVHRHQIVSNEALYIAALDTWRKILQRVDVGVHEFVNACLDDVAHVLLEDRAGLDAEMGRATFEMALHEYMACVERVGVRKGAITALFHARKGASPGLDEHLEQRLASWAEQLGGERGALTHVTRSTRAGGLTSTSHVESS